MPADLPAHLEPVLARQAKVEHHHIGALGQRQLDRPDPVVGDAGAEPGTLQVIRHHAGQHRLVVYHQHVGRRQARGFAHVGNHAAEA